MLSFVANNDLEPASDDIQVFASSLAAESADLSTPLTLPPGPAPPADAAFEGWFAASGPQVTDTTNLETLYGATTDREGLETLYAGYLQVIGEPSSQSVSAGSDASFTTNATGDGEITVQWQSCPAAAAGCSSGSADWADIPGATSSLLSLSAVPAAGNGTEYRAVYSDPYATVASDAATLTVTSSAPASGGNGTATTIPTTTTQPGTITPSGTSGPASNTFTVSDLKIARTGTLTATLRAADPGTFTIRATFSITRKVTVKKGAKKVVEKKTTTYTYATATLTVTSTSIAALAHSPSKAAVAELKKIAQAKLTVSITFTPTGGTALTKKSTVTVKRSRRGIYS